MLKSSERRNQQLKSIKKSVNEQCLALPIKEKNSRRLFVAEEKNSRRLFVVEEKNSRRLFVAPTIQRSATPIFISII